MWIPCHWSAADAAVGADRVALRCALVLAMMSAVDSLCLAVSDVGGIDHHGAASTVAIVGSVLARIDRGRAGLATVLACVAGLVVACRRMLVLLLAVSIHVWR